MSTESNGTQAPHSAQLIAGMRAIIDSMAQEQLDMQQREAMHEKECDVFRLQIDALHDKILAEQQRLSEVQSVAHDREEQIEQLTKENAKKQATIDDNKRELQTMHTENTRLLNEISARENQLLSAQTQLIALQEAMERNKIDVFDAQAGAEVVSRAAMLQGDDSDNNNTNYNSNNNNNNASTNSSDVDSSDTSEEESFTHDSESDTESMHGNEFPDDDGVRVEGKKKGIKGRFRSATSQAKSKFSKSSGSEGGNTNEKRGLSKKKKAKAKLKSFGKRLQQAKQNRDQK